MKKSEIRPEHLEEDLLSFNKIIELLENSDLTNKNIELILKATNQLQDKINNKYPKNLDTKK